MHCFEYAKHHPKSQIFVQAFVYLPEHDAWVQTRITMKGAHAKTFGGKTLRFNGYTDFEGVKRVEMLFGDTRYVLIHEKYNK